jgi:hypothetical protein
MKDNHWRHWWRRYRQDAAAVFLVTVFFTLFFYPIFFSGKFFIINDSFLYLYPLRVTAWNTVKSGSIPIWTPLIMSGYPILSMAQIGLGYPLTWGYAFLPGHWGEQIYTVTPHLLTPIFLYAYMREIGQSRLASILAGLTFGYGGMMVSAVANNGLTSNSVMWLPLMLIAIERSRTRPLIPCLVGAVAAYTVSVLTGYGQGFVYAGAIALAYGLFLVIATRRQERSWQRWRPFLVTVVAMVLSAGIAAFQILETMRAQRRSIRSVLSYQTFTEGAYTLALWFKSFLFPLHYINHATAWVSPLACVLAVVAVVAAWRGIGPRDLRIFFWTIVAIFAALLMLGPNTPLYKIVYRIPVINSFRAPARHAYEFTLAVAILSAYGWDYVSTFLAHAKEYSRRREVLMISVGVILLGLGVMSAFVWHFEYAKTPPLWDESNHYPSFPENRYLFWKLVLAAITLVVVLIGWKVSAARYRAGLLIGAIIIASFVEPSLMAARWWWPALKTTERLNAASATTRFLKNYPTDQNRIYMRTILWNEEHLQDPRIDTGNLAMPHGLRNAGGYEPLILERYSRALGNVWMDASSPRAGATPNLDLFEPRSHVLDILNTSFVVSYSDLLTEPTPVVQRDGIRLNSRDLEMGLKPGETKELKGVAHEADLLALVTSLSDSADEPDGSPVATLRLFTSEGEVLVHEIRAGVESSEWAHDRPDVKNRVRHQRATVFDSFAVEGNDRFMAHRYWARFSLRKRARVDRIEIMNVSAGSILSIWKIALYDSATKYSMPLPHFDLDRWESVYENDGVQIIRNQRVLPRAWLVNEAVAVDGEEALRRIRGESNDLFDPRRTALLEVPPAELPALEGGPSPSDSSVRLLADEPGRMVFETNSSRSSVLVVSEVIYPGWQATVDNKEVPIHTTNFILRGVVVPAGKHLVEMRYTAPAARNGAIISLATLFLLGGLAVWHRRTSMR